MNLLAIDTATEACSAALWIDGEITQQYQLAPQQHAKLLLPMIDQLLDRAGLKPVQIDGIAVGRGPGSFTGVRIAAAATQAISFVTDCPVVPVSTLAAMAHRAWREHQAIHTVALIDARMDQVYWGCYGTTALGETRALNQEQVSYPTAVTLPQPPDEVDVQQWTDSWIGLGSGMQAYANQLGISNLSDGGLNEIVLPAAVDLLHLSLADFRAGNTVSAEEAVPVYLRENVALTEQERAG